MATLKMFAVRDNAAEAFNQPFIVPSEGLAIRGFVAACRQEGTALNKYPGDHALYRVGEFVEASGCVVGLDVPVRVITGLEALSVEVK